MSVKSFDSALNTAKFSQLYQRPQAEWQHLIRPAEMKEG